jgi:hypothetical protein
MFAKRYRRRRFYDNNSKDRTVEVARRRRGALRATPGQGASGPLKFADIDADIYVLVDGGTYEAPSVVFGYLLAGWCTHRYAACT